MVSLVFTRFYFIFFKFFQLCRESFAHAAFDISYRRLHDSPQLFSSVSSFFSPTRLLCIPLFKRCVCVCVLAFKRRCRDGLAVSPVVDVDPAGPIPLLPQSVFVFLVRYLTGFISGNSLSLNWAGVIKENDNRSCS